MGTSESPIHNNFEHFLQETGFLALLSPDNKETLIWGGNISLKPFPNLLLFYWDTGIKLAAAVLHAPSLPHTPCRVAVLCTSKLQTWHADCSVSIFADGWIQGIPLHDLVIFYLNPPHTLLASLFATLCTISVQTCAWRLFALSIRYQQ